MSGDTINPIIPGFAPEPSVVLIDGTYFLVNSSFHVFPGLPVYASKDLVSWVHIGNAINRPGQLSLARAKTNLVSWRDGETLVAAGGIHAPTIRFHGGTVYIICTNIPCGSTEDEDLHQSFIITTDDIWSDNWSDPVFFDFCGFDPSLFFGDDGRAYVQVATTEDSEINQFEIDVKTGRKLSEQKVIWTGFTKAWPAKGPHIYKKDGYYYLLMSEGHTFNHHMLCIARSTDIWGPYTSFDKNPILTADGTDEYIQHVGHGDLFQDTHGAWWAVVLGVRKAANDCYVMGRETFLTGVDWPQDGWPSINPVRMEVVHDEGHRLLAQDEGMPLRSGEKIDFVYIRDPELDRYQFSNDGQRITLTAREADISASSGAVTFIGKRQRRLEGTATVIMNVPSRGRSIDINFKAGMALYKDEHRYLGIFYNSSTSCIKVQAHNKARKVEMECNADIHLTGPVALRIRYTEEEYEFSFRQGKEEEWDIIDIIDTKDMSGFGLTGPLIGVFAAGGGQEKDIAVQFDGLEID